MLHVEVRWLVAASALSAALSGCASSPAPASSRDADAPDAVDAHAEDAPEGPPPADREIDGRAVVALVRAAGDELWWVEERLAAIPWRAGVRELGPRRLMRARGAEAPRVIFEPPSDERLVSVTAHPSGAWSAVVTSASLEVALVRGDEGGSVRATVTLDDPALADDRGAWQGDAPPRSPTLGGRSEDSVRVAADGEDVVVSLTTQWNSVMLYRWRWSSGAWARGPRTLVSPAAPVEVFIPDTASYDVFDAIVAPWTTHLCVDEGGAAHVAIWVDHVRLLTHNRVLGTSLALLRGPVPRTERPTDILVTRVGRDGARGLQRIVGTPDVDDEPFAIACARGRVAVAGRHRREPGRDNTEFHGFAAVFDGAGGEARTLSFDGDALALAQSVAFDDDGAVLLGGAEGWTQNPVGVSVGGEGRPFLLRWSGVRGEAPVRLSAPVVPGHGELRAIAVRGAARWLAGIARGPVTHTWDADRANLRGDGWIRGLAAR